MKISIQNLSIQEGRLLIEPTLDTKHIMYQLIQEYKTAKKPYDAEIGQRKTKRSLDANNYCWVLCKKISEVLRITDIEVYREIIKRVGQYQIVPIRDDAVDTWVKNWQNNGVGWLAEIKGDCKNIKGFKNVKCYYGSSTYDSKEMSILIDEIVSDAKMLDIETCTPAELEKYKNEWGRRD